jgi:hypothetical protein
MFIDLASKDCLVSSIESKLIVAVYLYESMLPFCNTTLNFMEPPIIG